MGGTGAPLPRPATISLSSSALDRDALIATRRRHIRIPPPKRHRPPVMADLDLGSARAAARRAYARREPWPRRVGRRPARPPIPRLRPRRSPGPRVDRASANVVDITEAGLVCGGRRYRFLSAVGARYDRHALVGATVLRPAGKGRGRQERQAHHWLRHLHPQVFRGGTGAGLQLPRRAARRLRVPTLPAKRPRAGARSPNATATAAYPAAPWRGLPFSACWPTSMRAGSTWWWSQDRPLDPRSDRLRAAARALDAAGCSFVSVTRAFNTATSMADSL
jgi:hypothetical protein